MTAAVLLALALAAPVPRAAEAVARGPVRVDADEVQYAFQKHEVTFTGKRPVVLTRDDATLSCRRIVARTDEAGQIVTASCTGDVRFVRGPRVVTCDHATFEDVAERVTCDGNAVLRDGATEARGGRLVYDLKGDVASLERSKDTPTTITLPGEEIEQRRRAIEEKRRAGKAGGTAKVAGKEQRP